MKRSSQFALFALVLISAAGCSEAIQGGEGGEELSALDRIESLEGGCTAKCDRISAPALPAAPFETIRAVPLTRDRFFIYGALSRSLYDQMNDGEQRFARVLLIDERGEVVWELESSVSLDDRRGRRGVFLSGFVVGSVERVRVVFPFAIGSELEDGGPREYEFDLGPHARRDLDSHVWGTRAQIALDAEFRSEGFALADDPDVAAIKFAYDVAAPDDHLPMSIDDQDGLGPDGEDYFLESTGFLRRDSAGSVEVALYQQVSAPLQRCSYANERRFRAIVANPPEALDSLLSYSDFRGSFTNVTRDHDVLATVFGEGAREGARVQIEHAQVSGGSEGLWDSHLDEDGVCHLPTYAQVERMAQRCADQAADRGGSIEWCGASREGRGLLDFITGR